MARSEAQVKADVKWHKKAYERIPFDVRRDADNRRCYQSTRCNDGRKSEQLFEKSCSRNDGAR